MIKADTWCHPQVSTCTHPRHRSIHTCHTYYTREKKTEERQEKAECTQETSDKNKDSIGIGLVVIHIRNPPAKINKTTTTTTKPAYILSMCWNFEWCWFKNNSLTRPAYLLGEVLWEHGSQAMTWLLLDTFFQIYSDTSELKEEKTNRWNTQFGEERDIQIKSCRQSACYC